MVKGLTNGEGKITFIVEEGAYSWTVSKEEYETRRDRVTVTKDITIDVELPPLAPPISIRSLLIGLGMAMPAVLGLVFYRKKEE